MRAPNYYNEQGRYQRWAHELEYPLRQQQHSAPTTLGAQSRQQRCQQHFGLRLGNQA